MPFSPRAVHLWLSNLHNIGTHAVGLSLPPLANTSGIEGKHLTNPLLFWDFSSTCSMCVNCKSWNEIPWAALTHHLFFKQHIYPINPLRDKLKKPVQKIQPGCNNWASVQHQPIIHVPFYFCLKIHLTKHHLQLLKCSVGRQEANLLQGTHPEGAKTFCRCKVWTETVLLLCQCNLKPIFSYAYKTKLTTLW